MNWKSAYRSIYYQDVPESEGPHHKELEIINMIYCHIMSSAGLKEMMNL